MSATQVWARPKGSSGKWHLITIEGEGDDAIATRLCTGVPETTELEAAPEDLADEDRCGNCVKKLDAEESDDAEPAKPKSVSLGTVIASYVVGGPVFCHDEAEITAKHEDGTLDLRVPPQHGRNAIVLERCSECDLDFAHGDFRYPSWKATEEPAPKEGGEEK